MIEFSTDASRPSLPHGVTIRLACPDDARACAELFHTVSNDPDSRLLTVPGEDHHDVEVTRRHLTRLSRGDEGVCFLALADGAVVGSVDISRAGKRAIRHVGTLGVHIHSAWRGRGVGRALLRAALRWARDSGYLHRVELSVYATHAPAVRLYQSVGFRVEGCRRSLLCRDGVYHDCLHMGILIPEIEDD